MRNLISAVAVGLLAVSPLAAQPTITHLQNIDLSGLEVAPVGVVYGNDAAYVAGNAQRVVLKVNTPLSATNSAAVLYDTNLASDPTNGEAWDAFEGPITVDFRDNSGTPEVLVAGDDYADGSAWVVDGDTGSVIARSAPTYDAGSGASPRRIAGAIFYGTNIVGQFQAGNNYWQFTDDLSAFSGPAFYSGPNGNGSGPDASRDMVLGANGTIYISWNDAFLGDGDDGAGLHRILDDDANLSLTGNSNTVDWYTATADVSGSGAQGIGHFTYLGDSTDYVLLTLQNLGEVRVIDTTDASLETTWTDSELQHVRDATVATVGSNQYLLVVQNDTGGSGGARLSVFGIDGATLDPSGTNVTGWELY